MLVALFVMNAGDDISAVTVGNSGGIVRHNGDLLPAIEFMRQRKFDLKTQSGILALLEGIDAAERRRRCFKEIFHAGKERHCSDVMAVTTELPVPSPVIRIDDFSVEHVSP